MPIPVVSDISGNCGTGFDPASIPSQQGKVFIVTGGHAGIGLATTRFLSSSGARVIIASRTQTKVDEAIKQLVTEDASLSDRLSYVKLDLSSLKQVKAAAEEVVSKEGRLDGLVNNAGVMAAPYELTEDGIESQFQVNHLGHWLFTQKLMPLLEKTAETTGHPSRVINLSSFAHNFISAYPLASPSFTSLADVNRTFEPTGWIRYSQAKLSAILFSRELNRRAETSGSKVRSLSVHPGFVRSDLYKHTSLSVLQRAFIGPEEGAYSSFYAAASPEVEEKGIWGAYLVPFAKVKQTTKAGDDAKLATDLWDLCGRLVEEKVGGI
ncbi:hypothetical protein BCR35DRAFT_297867 [Leucosporidium creatinivorum]|uniref:NAD(P)-binding protein n=1 Tax=Leucosporidium creatinivorum TaxID=106004 RepID=A0A1Y2G3B9_9BASI|nr:hypothetical protein BCR35DRAFT_297867 [Leucosporidium creatinivorum]